MLSQIQPEDPPPDLERVSEPRISAIGAPNGDKYKMMSLANLPISPSTCLMVPPGLSPTSLLESPILLTVIMKEEIMSKRPAEYLPQDSSSKAPKATEEQTAHQVSHALVPIGPVKDVTDKPESSQQSKKFELVPNELQCLTLEGNPSYLRRLKDRNEIGYQRSTANKKPSLLSVEIDVNELRSSMTNVFIDVLKVRYYSAATKRVSEVTAEIAEIVPITVDMCMSALYAKLHNINKTYGKDATRYPIAPSYSKEIELPLPFAMAIQEFRVFTTHSIPKNFTILPTYPEGIEHEGRSKSAYPIVEYQSYLPTLRDLGIELKAVDPGIKVGSPWWTFKVDNVDESTDLQCMLPRSHYSDLSAIIRSVFCHADTRTHRCKDIIKHPTELKIYGTLMNQMPPGLNVRSFLALIHGPEDEWSFGTS